MSRYKNNHDGTYEPIARNLQIVDSPQEEFVTEGELTEALENYVEKEVFDSSFVNVPHNLLRVADGIYSNGDIKCVVKDNVLTFDGATPNTTTGVYVKVSNGLEIYVGTSKSSVPSSWKAESLDGIMEAGKKYCIQVYVLGGSAHSYTISPLVNIKGATNNELYGADEVFTYDGDGSYVYLYLGHTSSITRGKLLNNFSLVVSITEVDESLPLTYNNKDIDVVVSTDDIHAEYPFKLATFEQIVNIKKSSYSGVTYIAAQGLATDGTYIYMSLLKFSASHSEGAANIYKYTLSGELVTSVENTDLHHANSIAYCPFDDNLYICDFSDNPNVIHKVSASDLSYVGSVQVNFGEEGISHISYDEKNSMFITIGRTSPNKSLVFFDRDFNLLGVTPLDYDSNKRGILASLYADGSFIYCASALGEIYIYGYDGRLVDTLTYNNAPNTYEFEESFILNGSIYKSASSSSYTNLYIFKQEILTKRLAVSILGDMNPYEELLRPISDTYKKISLKKTISIFEGATITNNGDLKKDSTTKHRCRSELVGVNKSLPNTFSIAEGYKCMVFYYKKDIIDSSNFISNSASDWLTHEDGVISLNKKYDYVLFLFGAVSDTPITADEIYAAFSYDICFKLLGNELDGKTVAIIGDSVSCDSKTLENSPEITIEDADVGVELSAYVTSHDVSDSLSIGGHTFTASEIGTEVTFTPTASDVGKVIGKPNDYSGAPKTNWWLFASMALGFRPINVSWSGASISSHRSSEDAHKVSHAWHESQIRKCGIRTPGTMNRTAPDYIIIYRGINDFSYAPYPVLTDDYFDNVNWEYPTDDEISTGVYGFKEAYCLTIKKLRDAYPNAKIILCTLNTFKRVNYSHFPVNNGVSTVPQYNNAIREIADFMGCGLIEFDKDGITFENCYSEGYIVDSATTPTHPSQKGHKVMAIKAISDLVKQYGITNV